MRRAFLVIALVILGSFAGSVPPAAAAVSVSVNFFYDNLAPYGHWYQMDNYGWVWTPRHVAADWRPYTLGHWVFSDDYGWLWVSDEDFGWATCHYGRWFYDASYGWAWVPGEEWAPAWVSWRSGGGYVGWAPMPPEYEWRAGVGFRTGGFAADLRFGPRQYVFVPERDVFDPVVSRYVLPYDRNDAIVRGTREVTRYESVGDRIFNRGVSVREIEQASGRAVPRYRVEDVRSGAARRPVVQGNTVRVFHPTRQQIAQAPAPRTALPSPGAIPRVKPHPAQPPANPGSVRLERPPTARPGREDAARRDAERRQQQLTERQRQQGERQRPQEQARQQQLARQHEAQRGRQQQQAERQRQQGERQRQQEPARQQQLARQHEAQRGRQQQQARQHEAQQGRQQQQARQREAPQRQQQQAANQQALREQQQARQRAQQQREQQKRAQQARKKPPDTRKPPDQPSGA